MRLLLACFLLFLAPAGALFLTDRYVSVLEDDFHTDATQQVARLNGLIELYPPKVRRMRSASSILQLRGLSDGGQVAATVCDSADYGFRRLFDLLNARCSQWSLLVRARRSALLAVLWTLFTFALVLRARIAVRRCAARRAWPGNWTLWFVMKGLPVLLLSQVALSLVGYGIVLQTVTGKTLYALGILVVPFLLLFWLERRAVLAFVEPSSLSAYRPQGVKGARRRRPDRFATT